MNLYKLYLKLLGTIKTFVHHDVLDHYSMSLCQTVQILDPWSILLGNLP